MDMNLLSAEEGKEYIVQSINTDDEELNAFFVFLGVLFGRADYRGVSYEKRLRGLY